MDDVEEKYDQRTSPSSHEAPQCGHTDVVDCPLMQGPNVTSQSEKRCTALSLAELLFSMPLEIRQQIYYHALCPPPCDVYKFADESIIHVNFAANRRVLSTTDWGYECMTQRRRLLRVSRQVAQEASAVLYTAFTFAFYFSFPRRVSPEYVQELSHWLSAPPRRSIRHIRLNVALGMAYLDGELIDQHVRRDKVARRAPSDIILIGESMPKLASVHLCISFPGFEVRREAEKDWLIQRVIELAEPFRAVKSLVVEINGWHGGQRQEIILACKEMIRPGGNW